MHLNGFLLCHVIVVPLTRSTPAPFIRQTNCEVRYIYGIFYVTFLRKLRCSRTSLEQTHLGEKYLSIRWGNRRTQENLDRPQWEQMASGNAPLVECKNLAC